jgi:ABC-type transport system involved in multi-copper enzyme maturation permease subunit
MVASAERLPAVAPAPRLPFRLSRAELLKLRRRRGLMITAALLTIGSMIVMFVALELFHVSDSVKYGPAGGLDHFSRAVFVLSQLGSIAGALIGASAGADDLSSGVFRDLVATGRSRTALFFARVPGGLAVVWPLVAAGFAISAVAATALAGSDPSPSVKLLVESGLWLELTAGLAFLLGLGVGSLIGSRAPTVAILFAWVLIVEPLLTHISALGVGRDALLSGADWRLAPSGLIGDKLRVPMSLGVSIGVIAAWAVASLAVGLWRTRTRDA